VVSSQSSQINGLFMRVFQRSERHLSGLAILQFIILKIACTFAQRIGEFISLLPYLLYFGEKGVIRQSAFA
jgi:hypothetical protein